MRESAPINDRVQLGTSFAEKGVNWINFQLSPWG